MATLGMGRLEELGNVNEIPVVAADIFSQEHILASKLTAFLNRWAQHDLLPQISALLATTTKEDSMDEQPAAAKHEGHQAVIQAERNRMVGIQQAFTSVWGEKPPASEFKIRDGYIQLGTGVDDAARMFKERKLTVLTEAAPQ